jgi:hypothetical protein
MPAFHSMTLPFRLPFGGMREMAMRGLLRGSLVGLVIGLAAPAAHAQVFRGNDTGGIIPWSCENEAAARVVAGDHCAYYQKFARITSVQRRYGDYISFNCLWRPDIARFQIPPVGTRASCVRHVHVKRLHPRVRVRY